MALSLLTSAFVLIPSGYAAACVDHDVPTCDKTSVCAVHDCHTCWMDHHKGPGTPCDLPTPPCSPRAEVTPETEPSSSTPATKAPETSDECDGTDCPVVVENPGLTG